MLLTKEKRLLFILSFSMGLVVIASNYLVQFPVKFYNLEQCRMKTFCSEECLEEYNRTYSNNKCVAALLIVLLSFVLAFFTIVFFIANT